MKPEAGRKPHHKAQCLLKIAQAMVDEARRSLLINCVETYLPLSEAEQETFEQLRFKPELKEVATMLNVYEVRAEARGKALGTLIAKHETALMLLQVKFGELPPVVTARVQKLTEPAELDRLTAGILTASTLADLGLLDKDSDQP